jgi:hypothetical protein
MLTIYWLKLEHGKYYVGKTTQLNFRLGDHFSGNACEWTRVHKPISVLKIIPNCDHFDEDKYTKIAMSQFGIDNVRGGSYSQIELPHEINALLVRELRCAHDSCFACGRAGHFANNCPGHRHVTCFKCGKRGHYANECGFEEYETDEDESDDENDIVCYRCGKIGHYANQCFRR